MSNETSQSTSGRKIPLIPVFILIALLGFALLGDRGILRALQFSRQKNVLEAQVRQLEAENAELRREIEALQSDHRAIEGIARRELGMVKEDELVYQFRPAPKEVPAPEMKKP